MAEVNKEKIYYDIPADDWHLEKIKETVGNRRAQLPLSYEFEGAQSKDFYLGMASATRAITSAIHSGYEGPLLKDFLQVLSMQATLHAYDRMKETFYITFDEMKDLLSQLPDSTDWQFRYPGSPFQAFLTRRYPGGSAEQWMIYFKVISGQWKPHAYLIIKP